MFFSHTKHKSAGFTLIELLIVIAIIGILSSVVLVSLNSARLKARDANRKAQLSNIRALLEMYHADHGYYPREADGSNGKVGEGGGIRYFAGSICS